MPRQWRVFWRNLIIEMAILWMLLIIFLVSSCKVATTAILPEGQIIERDGSRYLIIWKDMGDKPHSYAYNWVYLPELDAADIADYEAKIILQKRKKP